MLKTNSWKGLPLPRPIRNRGASLLQQQCWCWEQDVRSQPGNRLIEYGFARRPCPQGREGGSSYVCDLNVDVQITLWGFGFLIREKDLGSMFLGRFDFQPRWASARNVPDDIHCLDDLTRLAYPGSRHEWFCANFLMIRGLHWISVYETWIRNRHGTRCREDSLNGFEKLAAPAHEIVECWKRLVTECEWVFSERLSSLSSANDLLPEFPEGARANGRADK